MTDTPPTEPLSKKEQKKMAKKAEKAANKQATTTPAAAAAVATVAPETAADPTTTTTTTAAPPPQFFLLNARVDDPSTLKVVWAAQRYQVTLKAAAANSSEPATAKPHFFVPTTTTASSSPPHAVLKLGDQVVGGGGNAMAMALATKERFAYEMMVDEWCEWERTVLRPSVRKSASGADDRLKTVLQQLELVLQHGTGLHIIPGSHHDSVADICILVTLADAVTATATVLDAFPAVHRYWHVHQSAHQAAQHAVTALLASQSGASSSRGAAASVTTTMDYTKEPRLNHIVHDIFSHVVRGLFGDIELPNNIVQPCQDNKRHGDFQCTAAMPTFAALKKMRAEGNASHSEITSPQQVAQALIDAIGPDHPVLMELDTNGPGFVLCRLRPAFLEQHLNVWLPTGKLPMPPVSQKQTCVVDFSSPNIAKEMHVGHLRSTIIGESVCRILEAAGHTVHRVNHVGDWGTQFGMLIQYLKEEYPDMQEQESPNISDLTAFYKHAKERFDQDADFKKTAQLNVVKLQSGDAECLKIWKLLCDISRREFEKVYRRLDVTVEECGESFYNPHIPPVIEEFQAAGKISIEEGGAKCVFLPGFKVPLMLQKSDGGFGYDSTDMAALKYRLFTLHADRIICITDFSQGDHFKMVFAAGREIGWVNAGQRLEHIGFGTVMGEDGKRFKTRSGETVRLVDLLDEAVQRMETSLNERIAEGKANITTEQVQEVAEAIGYGAVKYYDLRRNPTSNYKFSYDQMLSTSGDTAVYLLYARVRLESIAAKAKAEFNVDVEDLLKQQDPQPQIVLAHPSERSLAFQLQKYADVMEQTLDDLYPYHICDYVYKLANAASDFVTQCKVLGSPEMNSRLLLCHATTLAMHQCFDLLGIRHVKRI